MVVDPMLQENPPLTRIAAIAPMSMTISAPTVISSHRAGALRANVHVHVRVSQQKYAHRERRGVNDVVVIDVCHCRQRDAGDDRPGRRAGTTPLMDASAKSGIVHAVVRLK